MTTFIGMSTKVIDLIYEAMLKIKVNIYDNNPNSANLLSLLATYNVTYNNIQYTIYVARHGVSIYYNLRCIMYIGLYDYYVEDDTTTYYHDSHDEDSQITLVDLRMIQSFTYETDTSVRAYKSTELLDLSTEERFYHEINSSTIVNNLIDFNEYIKDQEHDYIYNIRVYDNYFRTFITSDIDDELCGILTEYNKVL